MLCATPMFSLQNQIFLVKTKYSKIKACGSCTFPLSRNNGIQMLACSCLEML